MVEAQAKMQTEKVIAYMVIAGLIGFLIDTLMVLAENVVSIQIIKYMLFNRVLITKTKVKQFS